MKIFCYQRNIELWRRKTAKLSLTQRGIYSELIDWYYCTGGKLPSDIDELCRMVGATRRQERDNLKSIVFNTELFTIDGARLVQKMCDETLSSIARKSSKASASARAKYNKNNDLADANAERSDSERSANHKLRTNNQVKSPKGLFDEGIKPKKFDALKMALPSCISSSIWQDWVAHRKAVKKPLSEKAAQLCIKDLTEFNATGHAPETIINASIKNGWQGLFAPKVNGNSNGHAKRSYSDEIQTAMAGALRTCEKINNRGDDNEIPY